MFVSTISKYQQTRSMFLYLDYKAYRTTMTQQKILRNKVRHITCTL